MAFLAKMGHFKGGANTMYIEKLFVGAFATIIAFILPSFAGDTVTAGFQYGSGALEPDPWPSELNPPTLTFPPRTQGVRYGAFARARWNEPFSRISTQRSKQWVKTFRTSGMINHMALGYAFGFEHKENAERAAIDQCEKAVIRYHKKRHSAAICEPLDTWNTGCGFLSINYHRNTESLRLRGSPYWASLGIASAGSPEDIKKACAAAGDACAPPVGGCIVYKDAPPAEKTNRESDQASMKAQNYLEYVKNVITSRFVDTSKNVIGSYNGTIAFWLDDNGNITRTEIAKPSGLKELDELALKAVRESSPFPPPPFQRPFSFEFSTRNSQEQR
jgi:TonB family protein